MARNAWQYVAGGPSLFVAATQSRLRVSSSRLGKSVVGVGELTTGGQRDFLVPTNLVTELADVFVDLVGIVAAHHLGEVTRRGLFEEAGQLSVNVRLHVA